MRKVLVINGSHKKYNSYTMKVTEEFLAGMIAASDDIETEIIDLKDQKILPCISCFTCWTVTPGECIHQDEMKELLEKYVEADLIIWSTPLYHYGISSMTKNFMERTLPLLLPFIDPEGDGVYGHPFRDQEKMATKKHILISTCGLPTQEKNYEGVFAQFDNLFGKEEWEKIICVEGELLGISQLDLQTRPYLEMVKLAGEKYLKEKKIPKDIRKGLDQPFLEIPAYIKTANLKWGVDDTRLKESDGGLIGWDYMKRLEASFNPRVRPGMDGVLQIELTDVKEAYQLVIKDNQCRLLRNDFSKATTSIDTQLTTLERIFEGHIDLGQTILDKKLQVEGSFEFINAMMDGLFGELVFHHEKSSRIFPISFKNTPYWFILTLIPWFFSQLVVDSNPFLAVILALVMSGFLYAIKKGQELVFFDKITLLYFSLLTIVTIPQEILLSKSIIGAMTYFVLMGIFLISAFKTIPLTADYSHFLVGKNAMKDALFIRTNRIISVVWGIVCFFQAVLTILLNNTAARGGAALIPVFLWIPTFVFSIWFLKWYPINLAKPSRT